MSFKDVSEGSRFESEEGQAENAILLRDYDHANPRTSTESIRSEASFNSIVLTKTNGRWHSLQIPCAGQVGGPLLYTLNIVFQFLKARLLFFLPSFIYPWNPATPPKPPHPTAYLDGLRGIAALCVAMHHFGAQFVPATLEGYESGPRANAAANKMFIQLPLIRIFVSGQFMVVLFYIMSGCVLSTRGLKLARNKKQAAFAKTMASSVFRRWVRLHLPVIAAMFISMLISQTNNYLKLKPNWLKHPHHNKRSLAQSATRIFAEIAQETDNTGIFSRAAPKRHNWYHKTAHPMPWAAQLRQWLVAVIGVCNPLNMGRITNLKVSELYNQGGILWTIPGEWLGSMIIFLVLLGVAWTPSRMRFGLILMITLWCHWVGRWEIASFLSGMVVAELMLDRDERIVAKTKAKAALPTAEADVTDVISTPQRRWRTSITELSINAVCVTGFLIGLYFGSIPYSYPSTSYGYRTLVQWRPRWYKPSDRYYLCLGSILVLLSITYCSLLQRLFATRFMRYLGRISFSLYLLHAQIIVSVGIRVMTWSMKYVGGGETTAGYVKGFTLGVAIVAPIVLWCSDVFCRAVDEQSVELARWFADKFLKFEE